MIHHLHHCSIQQSYHIVSHCCSLLHHNPPNIWIKIIQIAIQIECFHRTKFLNPDLNIDRDPDNVAPCKRSPCV